MIKCSKCGAELSDDARFCSYCGNKIETPPPIEKETVTPDVPQSEPVKISAKKSDVPKSLADKIKDKASEKWHTLGTYGKITIVAIIVFLLLCLVAFLFGKTAAGIIAALQIVLTVVAVLMKKRIIKVPKGWIHFIALALAIVLLVPYVSLFKVDYGDAEKFVWSDILLADAVPEPESLFGEIIGNSDEYLSLNVYKTSAADYSEYVDACKEKGFTVETNQSKQSYYAYNADGYKLSLYYDENDSKMHISVNAAEQYGTLVWPDSVIARMLPIPTSTTGKITQDDEKGFQAYVSNTPIDEFTTYVVACADRGFNIDAYDSAESYSAENNKGYKLFVSYQGNSVISVSVDVPEYSEHGKDEVPMPQSASSYKHENYVDVQKELAEAGYTNISFKILYDIILGWTKEGEVDSISVDGNTEFEQGDIFKKDAAIVITYHMKETDDPDKPVENETPGNDTTEPAPVQNLTADNCPDLAALLALRDPSDPSVSTFASKYNGQVIEFDGCVTAMQNHGSYATRWDILFGAGDFNENSMRGPNFHLTDVNYYDMNVSGGDSVYVGLNVYVVAEVGDYNTNTALFELDVISIEIKD